MEWIPSKFKQRSTVYFLNILSWKSKPCLKISLLLATQAYALNVASY